MKLSYDSPLCDLENIRAIDRRENEIIIVNLRKKYKGHRIKSNMKSYEELIE